MLPPVGLSSPPMRLSNVVLPEPDGPIKARNSPSGMPRLTPFSTSIRSDPRLKCLWTSRTFTREFGLAIGVLLLTNSDLHAVGQRRRRRDDDALARGEASQDLHAVAVHATRLDRAPLDGVA